MTATNGNHPQGHSPRRCPCMTCPSIGTKRNRRNGRTTPTRLRTAAIMKPLLLLVILTLATSFQPVPPTVRHAPTTLHPNYVNDHQPSLASFPTTTIPVHIKYKTAVGLEPLEQTLDQDDVQKRLERWKSKYCSITRMRNVHGRCKNGDCGDWNTAVTRTFYKFKISRAIQELRKIGLPKKELGALAFEARKAIKTYARERSKLCWRMYAQLVDGMRQFLRTGKFDTKGKSLKQLQEEKRFKVLSKHENIDDLTEEILEELVSMEILECAGRSNKLMNKLAVLDVGADLCELVRQSVDRTNDVLLKTKEDIVALVMLESAIVQVLSPECKQFFRSVFPDCYRKLKVSRHYRPRRA